MNEGRIVARGTVDGIRERHGETTYHVYTDVAPEPVSGEAESDADAIGDAEEVGDRYRTVVPSMNAVERVRTAVSAAGGAVVDIRTREPSLEDVFLDLVGRPMPGRRGGVEADEDGDGDRVGGGDRNRDGDDRAEATSEGAE
jgi:ABC-2 type transport system ATP-binding protein